MCAAWVLRECYVGAAWVLRGCCVCAAWVLRECCVGAACSLPLVYPARLKFKLTSSCVTTQRYDESDVHL